MMPNCAWPGVDMDTSATCPADSGLEARPVRVRAQRSVRAIAARVSSWVAGQLGHSSNIIATSAPRRAWMSAADSGDSESARPSRCDWNTTPSSDNVRRPARLKTW